MLSLRGPEGFLLDLKGLNRHWEGLRNEFVVFALLGKVKGELHNRAHLLPSATSTKLGLNVKETVKRFLDLKRKEGFTDGPAIANREGQMYRTKDLDDMLHKILLELFEDQRELFPVDINTEELVLKNYQCYRTFQRSLDTQAMDKKISELDVKIVNRWAKVEGAKGKRPAHMMPIHYAQFEHLLKPFLWYTSAM